MSIRMRYQTMLAIVFLLGFFGLILLPLISLSRGVISVDTVINIQKGVSSSLGPLVGSIVGYYYGTRRMLKTQKFEQCVYEDLPDDKVSNFILQSEKLHPKLKYVARPAKSGKLNHKDIWSYLKPGEEP